MVHYGHSCLVPIDITTIKMLYVFVDISIDVDHVRTAVYGRVSDQILYYNTYLWLLCIPDTCVQLIECMKLTFKPDTKVHFLVFISFGPCTYLYASKS